LWRLTAFALVGALLVAGVWSGVWLSRQAQAVRRLTRGVGDTVFYSADGRPWFRLDEQRDDVPLGAIAESLQHAVVAVEDHRFYYHPGLDPIGIARAMVSDVRAGARVQGGSTLTQQLARTLFLSNARTFNRKAKEAALALLIEVQLTKPQILELYLNRVYLSAGVYGVEAMAQHLFRKPARNLTLAESALVAGLIRAPSALSPWSNYEGALERSRIVLARMRDEGFITAEQEAQARAARPRVQPYRQARDVRAAWAKEYLRQQFRREFGGDHPPDWRVQTTFDTGLQDAAERAVAAGLRRLNRKGLEAALVALDPRTGNVLAMVGGADYRQSTFNRAVRARRQPGSAFKPFLFAAALARGYSPVSIGEGGLTLRAALAESNNEFALALQQRIGTRAVRDVGEDAGLGDLPDVPSLALGTGLASPLELTAAYGIFAAGGEAAAPRAIVSVANASGGVVLAQDVRTHRVISRDVAFQMVSLLRGVVDRGTASAARTLGVTGPIGGKTGTTNDYRDAWFVGFSSSVVAGVWVGFDRPASIGPEAYAARVALPIWAEFMKRTASRLPAREFPMPDTLEPEELCSVTYLRPVDGCPTYVEFFKDGDDKPSGLCGVHRGSLKQRAVRAVQGWFRSLGDTLAGIFRN
jgi:penicillin-binding protein 1A